MCEVQERQSANYIENLFSGYEREIVEETLLVNEKSYMLDRSLRVSTGISLARGGHPIVKITQSSNKRIQFTPSEWDVLWENQYLEKYFNANTCVCEKNFENVKLSANIKVIYACVKVKKTQRHIAVVRLESRGVVVSVKRKIYQQLQRIRELLINYRLRRLQSLSFSYYYNEIIRLLATFKQDNESIENVIKWLSTDEKCPTEYQECIHEIVLFFPNQIRASIGSVKGQ